MMSSLIVLTVLLLLWVGIGMVLLYLQGRPVGEGCFKVKIKL
jgi:hypothetical protein